MNSSSFFHVVEIDEATRMLKIRKVFSDGRRDLFTETAIPANATASGLQFDEFARLARTSSWIRLWRETSSRLEVRR